ncbi:hypothetical protein [Cytobacillus sp. IB215665]|uniref:hypothetical protein n=1 Tax=Cytobacillus sp. IB215665 TaxID=3097357 RepID=UPI002A182750|nr:hypothetical protein [Cytobacillus sp. IB215665]MDX8367078.1 hypothetical protein [Cytobacillus sp. IB215665]
MFSERHNLMFAIGLVFTLSSIIAPVYLYFFQGLFSIADNLNHSWYFTPLTPGYIMLAIGFGLIGVGLFIYVFLVSKLVKKIITRTVLVIFTTASIVLMYFSLHSYLYMTTDGILLNDKFSLKEELYKWEDIEAASFIGIGNGHKVIKLTYTNGVELELQDAVYKNNMKKILKKHEVAIGVSNENDRK